MRRNRSNRTSGRLPKNDPTGDFVCPRTRQPMQRDPISGRMKPHPMYFRKPPGLRWTRVDAKRTPKQLEVLRLARVKWLAQAREMRELGIKGKGLEGPCSFVSMSKMNKRQREFIKEIREKHADRIDELVMFLMDLHKDETVEPAVKVRATTDALRLLLHPEMTKSEINVNRTEIRKVTFDDPEQARRVAAALAGTGEAVDAGAGLPAGAPGGPAEVSVRLLPGPAVGDDDPEGRGEEP